MSVKRVYFFGNGKAEGSAEIKELIGSKGANLAEMTNLGVPVPPGFTISTKTCLEYLDRGEYSSRATEEVRAAVKKLEELMNSGFGDKENPLLVSVRSGAAFSMPGMMDTVLNLGLNDVSVEGLIKKSGSEKFALDCYRRFIKMYGDVVRQVSANAFEEALHSEKEKSGLEFDYQLSAEQLRKLIEKYKEIYRQGTGEDFPQDVWEQLWSSINAVFDSWNTPRAIKYREINKLPHNVGTGVNIQTMVFGNLGDDCATGVAFTRNPSTGENTFYGEFLQNAQGEDVVAGIRTPFPINNAENSLEVLMPDAYKELLSIREKLEKHYRDMQDVEFTIQNKKLYMLQTRAGKRTGIAAVKMALDMVEEGMISEKEAISRVDPVQLEQLLAPTFNDKAKKKALDEGRLLTVGLNAGPGAASGKVVLSAEKAEDMVNNKGEKVILVRIETSAEDVGGMNVAEGILTARGGMTSHAAVVARGMGKSCVCGAKELEIDYLTKQFKVGGKVIKQGEYISIDGTTGEVIAGELETQYSEINRVLVDGSLPAEDAPVYRLYEKFMSFVDGQRKMAVRTNADTPEDAKNARNFGAEGIGLCRTEHMFFEGKRIMSVREMILASSLEERKKALAKLIELQRSDFIGIFKAMDGFPVTVRLLDPPLHEFLPQDNVALEELAINKKMTLDELKAKVESLHESNPMLGHRGCRLGISYPEIYEMQVMAIMEAACQLTGEGYKVIPEIMIPLVSENMELKVLRELTINVAEKVIKDKGVQVDYLVGTMIETPRAALSAEEIGKHADFFSFGTNDLTQMTFGFSRDDAGSFLPDYISKGILANDPFQILDRAGVGKLLEMGLKDGRKTKPDLKVGICGEHGGEPSSVEFCYGLGFNYVSCSPFRVPIARLAAARATIDD